MLSISTLFYSYLSIQSRSSLLSDDAKIRMCKRSIPRCALKKYSYSSISYLFQSRNDQAILNYTGCDHATFSKLLRKFEPYYDYFINEDKTGIIRRNVLKRNGQPYDKTL